ncbi:hypothetical protein [Burkholderia reimsis]|uniref:hypothetical protein n=1 Tax=Burkholderia reimsis TaxID=2234132 RepID=UPI001058AD90|nr:hypothetical protein [Burkholderia reimsis]
MEIHHSFKYQTNKTPIDQLNISDKFHRFNSIQKQSKNLLNKPFAHRARAGPAPAPYPAAPAAPPNSTHPDAPQNRWLDFLILTMSNTFTPRVRSDHQFQLNEHQFTEKHSIPS